MNKTVLALMTILFSSQVFAAATLRIPFILVDDNTGRTAPVRLLNVKLAAAGLKTLPEFIVISTNDNGIKKIEAAQEQLAKAISALGEDPEMIRLEGGEVPTAADIKQFSTCYTGNPEEVNDIAQGLTDILYSEQMTMHAMKYKNQVLSLSEGTEMDDPDTQEFFNEGSPLWKNWKGQNEDLLILSSTSDSGDDVQESLIPRCQ
ncbi:hypothetical protein D3C72_1546670 [compost metagenome]